MKILHVINSLGYGGAESLLSDMAFIQRYSGDDVCVVVLKDCDSGFKNKVISNGVQYIALSASMSIYNPIHIYKLIRYIRRFDIVHVHLFPAQYWVAIASILCLCKIPLVTTEHSTTNRRRNNWLLRIIDNFFYCHVYNMTICCSDKALETFRWSFPKARAISIPNGVNIDRIKSSKPINLSKIVGNKSSFIVTMVARLAYPKRQDTLIEALALLPSDVYLMLIGDGDNNRLNELKALAENIGVVDRVRFLGSRDDVPSILKSSDVVVLSSEYEGLSLSSIEGMASGKPFVATNVDGLREMVSDAGLLFECGNACELSGIINRLREDKIFYEMVANKCYIRAMSYDIHKTVVSYGRMYRDVFLGRKVSR